MFLLSNHFINKNKTKKQEETPIDLVKFHCSQAFDFEYGSSNVR